MFNWSCSFITRTTYYLLLYTTFLLYAALLPVLAAAPDMVILTLLQTLHHFIAPVDVLLKVICNSCVNNIYFQTAQYLTVNYSVSCKYLNILCTTGIYLIFFYMLRILRFIFCPPFIRIPLLFLYRSFISIITYIYLSSLQLQTAYRRISTHFYIYIYFIFILYSTF